MCKSALAAYQENVTTALGSDKDVTLTPMRNEKIIKDFDEYSCTQMTTHNNVSIDAHNPSVQLTANELHIIQNPSEHRLKTFESCVEHRARTRSPQRKHFLPEPYKRKLLEVTVEPQGLLVAKNIRVDPSIYKPVIKNAVGVFEREKVSQQRAASRLDQQIRAEHGLLLKRNSLQPANADPLVLTETVRNYGLKAKLKLSEPCITFYKN